MLVDSAAMLGALHYMRSDEETADGGGQALLVRAGIDADVMERAFGRLEKDSVGIPAYLSSHPATAKGRKKAAEFARSNRTAAGGPLMSAQQWQKLKSACLIAPVGRASTLRTLAGRLRMPKSS